MTCKYGGCFSHQRNTKFSIGAQLKGGLYLLYLSSVDCLITRLISSWEKNDSFDKEEQIHKVQLILLKTTFLYPGPFWVVILLIWFKFHWFLKQCLHDFQFMKTRPFSPKLSKLAPSDISWRTLYLKLKKTLSKLNGF